MIIDIHTHLNNYHEDRVVSIDDGRLTLALTEEAWRGFSGEGSLLPSLADPDVVDDADLIAALLAFKFIRRQMH